MSTCGQSPDDVSGTLVKTVPRAEVSWSLRHSMIFTYHRVGRTSLLPALAAAASAAIVVGAAAMVLVVVVVAGCGVWLLRAIGCIAPAVRCVPVEDDTAIEGVVVNSTDLS